MKKLPDRLAALEAVAPPATEYDLSDVPTAILEKLAAAQGASSLDEILDADELAVFEATARPK